MNNRTGHLSIFFSTIYNKAYYIVSSLTIALMLEFITTVNININSSVVYWIAFIIYVLLMYLLYIVCRKHKIKHSKLNIRQLSKLYITFRVLIMLAYTMIETIIISVIHVLIMVALIK